MQEAAAELLVVSIYFSSVSSPPHVLAFQSLFAESLLLILQTLQCMHVGAGRAHLDLTSSNVMISQQTAASVYRQHLRLIDFGFSQQCSAGSATNMHRLLLLPMLRMT